jgi:protein TonB
MAVSLAGQGIFIGAAVMLPLLYPETLQRAAFWLPVTGPPRAYRPAPPAGSPAPTAAAHRVFNPHTLFQPQAVPAKVAMLQEEPAAVTAASNAGPCIGCVPGGLDLPGPPPPPIADATGLTASMGLQPIQTAAVKPAVHAPAQPIRVGSGVQAAMLIHGPPPVYPPLARQARISGMVHLAALIGTDGRMIDLRATSGHPLLVKAALDAVKQWVYRPTLLNGSPVEVVTEITVTFTLN